MSQDDLAVKRQRIYDEKRNVTGRISETTRFVGFGLIAVYYAIRSSEPASLTGQMQVNYPCVVAIIGLMGVAAVLLDYLQYWFGSQAVAEALKRPTVDYDAESFWYKARGSTFVAKQFAAIIGAALLVILFANA